MKKLALAVLFVSLASCGKEMGRIPFTADGTADATMTLKAGEVNFWTDIDIKYEGDAELAYQITLEQSGKSVGVATCEPLGPISVKTGWITTDIGGSHSRSGHGKMSCSVMLASAGSTTVKATLAITKKPVSLTLKKADLVVKQ